MPPEPFERIYFDTIALDNGDWPKPNDLLEMILRFASELSISLYIPEPVEREIRNTWIRRVYGKHADLIKAVRGVTLAETFGSPDWNEIQNEFSRASETLKTKWRINQDFSSSIPDRTLTEAFREIVPLIPPFEGRYGPFRDRIIYMSMLETRSKC